jgi:hypothetical protein
MTGRVSSSASTGGVGTFFEQHVDAFWLAQLLVRAIPPILHDYAVVEVHFQTEHLRWNTDDFLVVGENGLGSRRKLVGQVKRTFTVSATDDECKKAVQDLWKDFTTPLQFSLAVGVFGLQEPKRSIEATQRKNRIAASPEIGGMLDTGY